MLTINERRNTIPGANLPGFFMASNKNSVRKIQDRRNGTNGSAAVNDNTFTARDNKMARGSSQQLNTSTLSAGVYEGIVTDVDMDSRTVDVKINGTAVHHCTYFPLFFSSYIGAACRQLPPLGAHVVVMFTGGRGYVMGGRVLVGDTPEVFKGRATGDSSDDVHVPTLDGFKKWFRGQSPEADTTMGLCAQGDMFPGEAELTDNMGTALRVLLGLAQLTSGDLAKVEVSLYNDMVRIVDNYFVHHMAGGDDLSWAWGDQVTNHESHFTSYLYEAEGKKDPHEPLSAERSSIGSYKEKDAPNMESRYRDTGRWRKSTYIGFLGDMIHTFVTEPTEVYSTIMEHSPRPGLFRSWVGTDGTLMIQANGGVHVEVTPKILVPEIHASWNDAEKMQDQWSPEEALEGFNTAYEELWGNGPDWKDLEASCWQMSAYLRYITCYHSLARFKYMEKTTGGKFCKVPDPSDAKAGEPTAKDKAKEKANGVQKQYKAQSSFSIDPSGSITAQSNGLASLVMTNGCIQMSAAGNIELHAGGTVTVDGRHISLRSVFEMEIVSTLGKITQKAKTAFKLFCEKGRLWLKSDADKNSKDYDSPVKDEDNKVEFNRHAVVIEAANGSVVSYAKGANLVMSKEGDEGEESGKGKKKAMGVVLQGKTVDVLSKKEVTVQSESGNMYIKASRVFMQFREVFMRYERMAFNRLFTLVGSTLKGTFNAFITSVETVSGYMGPSDSVMQVSDKEKLIEDTKPDEKALESDKKYADLFESNHLFKNIVRDFDKEEFKDKETSFWRFRKWKPGKEADQWNSIKLPPTHLAIDKGKRVNKGLFEKFDWEDRGKIADKHEHVEKNTTPWPGKSVKAFVYDASFPDQLGDDIKTKFEKDHIGGWAKMKKVPLSTFITKSGASGKMRN